MLRDGPAGFQTEFLKLADRAIEITGGNAESLITRSMVYYGLGQREKAIEDLASGLELDPDCHVRFALRPLLKELKDRSESNK